MNGLLEHERPGRMASAQDLLESSERVEPRAVQPDERDIAADSLHGCFPGYDHLEVLYSSNQVHAFRARDSVQGHKVFLKACLDSTHLDAMIRIRHEWTCQLIINDVAGIKIPRSIEACNDNKGIMLVFSDDGELSACDYFLRELGNPLAAPGTRTDQIEVRYSDIDLEKFLVFAIEIVRILHNLHERGVTHRNLNPLSIGVDAEGHAVLFDLSCCTFLEREDAQSDIIASRQLPFMSPESSGRINRSVDYRSDFYSLGITFYFLLTGVCPFVSDNALDLIYQHIAHAPTPLPVICPDLPKCLSSVVLKLMEKTAEERYHTGQGLISDLQNILDFFSEDDLPGHDDFVPGLTDSASQFYIPQRLFGRERDIQNLLSSFARVRRDGGSNLVIIKGGSGTGKSSLVNEIHRPVLESRSFYSSGKFDQYKRGIPFFSLLQACGELVRQLVSEAEFRLEEWKEEILQALAGDAAAIFDVVPELQRLYGESFVPPHLAELGPAEREQRFTAAFLRFILVFAKRGSPLVLFLDDIQWSSMVEMNLIASLVITALASPKQYSLTVIIAYRDNEVLEGHHALTVLQTIEAASVPISIIDVKSMPLEAVREMLCATLRIPNDTANGELETLTKLIAAKTDGNAFFITQLLRRFKESDQFFYDFERRTWKFDLAAILLEDLPASVVDLLVSQIEQLAPGTRNCLQMAACIGANRFSLRILAVVMGQRLKATGSNLWDALQTGLIVPTSSAYKVAAVNLFEDGQADAETSVSLSGGSTLGEEIQASDATYRFLHDRVQQASYQLVPTEQLAKVHMLIGLRLLKHFDEEDMTEGYIFEIVNQINRGLDALEPQNLTLAVELNLRAGKRALHSTAFDAAMVYLDTAKRLAPDSWWMEKFDLSLEINLAHTDATYALRDYATAVRNLKEVSEKTRDPIKRAQIMYRMIDVYMGLDDLPSAIETGFAAMELLGVRTPRTADQADAMLREIKPRLDLTPAQIDAIADMPLTTDPAQLLLQSLATSVCLPLYLSRPELLQAVVANVVLMSLESGVTEAGAYPLIMYGLTITHSQPTAKSRLQGYHLGLTAVKIANKSSALSPSLTAPKVFKVFASHISWWNEATRSCLVYFNSAITVGLQTFNVEYTSYAYSESCSYSFWAGEPLPSVVQRMTNYLPQIQKFKQKQHVWYCSIQLQGYVNLMSDTKEPDDIEGTHFSTEKEFDALVATDSSPQIFVLYMAKLLVAVYFYRPTELATALIQRAEKYIPGSQGTCYVAKFAFLTCSSLVSNYDILGPAELAKFYHYFELLKFYHSGVPTNFEHEIQFLEAEILTYENKELAALEKYESAYSIALQAGNIHEAGHIAERTHRWMATKSTSLAKKYLFKAYNCFKLAGFKAKTRELRSQYPDLLTSEHLAQRVEEDMVPFRSVNMQMNRDGTLSKIVAPMNHGSEQSKTRSPTRDVDEAMNDAVSTDDTEKTAETRPSVMGSMKSLKLRHMPPRTISHSSLMNSSESPHESELTPTGTMSSYLSRHKTNTLGRSTTISSTQRSQEKVRGNTNPSRNTIVEGERDFDLDVALKASVMISDVLQVSEVLKRLIETVLTNSGADYGVLLLVDKGNLYIEATGKNSSVNIVDHELLSLNSQSVPSTLVNYVSRLKETTVLGSGQDYRTFQVKFGKDPYFKNKRLRSIMCMPVQNSHKLTGVLYLENSSTAYTFGPRRVELLNFLCTQAAIAIEKARLYSDLEIAKNEAQASNKMKSEFLSTISHEIRTPFNAVLGMSGFLLDTQLTPMQIDYVETIRNSSKELLRVIDDILDFSKMEHGTFELHKADFSLRECIEGAMQITAERAASKELELAYFNNHADFPDLLINDITRFRQVVINLLGNSIKFTERGSVVLTSNAALMKPATATTNAVYRIQVSVKDTGIGIKEEDHKKLFKLFSQIDSSLARNFSGTGLGLAISEKLVRLMDGQIWVESEAGKGSTFHFTVNSEVRQAPPPAPHPFTPKLQGLGVLILDDSDVATRSLRETLEWLGMRVLITKSVDDLVQAISSHPPGSFRIALIDLHYGLADAVLPELAKYDPRCTIIRLSRFGFRQKFDEQYQYLIKPVKRERLARVVAETICPELAQEAKAIKPKDDGKIDPVGLATRHPLRILLAEDNMINSRVALQHLKRMGYSAVHAKDGQYCLEEEDKAIYDVILMDVQMPRLDGCQAATLLRAKYAEQPTRCPRIIAMTANAMRGDMERCLEAGMHAYCAKPIIVDALAQRLLEATRRPE